MPYQKRIKTLEESERMVNDQISKLVELGNPDPKKLANLREVSVKYNTELRNMIRAQWDHDHETVDYGDDR